MCENQTGRSRTAAWVSLAIFVAAVAALLLLIESWPMSTSSTAYSIDGVMCVTTDAGTRCHR